MSTSADRRVIACNFTEDTNSVSPGSLAYVVLTNRGSGNDRIYVLARSRGGRHIEIWQDMRRLGNFRWKTLPSTHPLFGNSRIADYLDGSDLRELIEAAHRCSGLIEKRI